MKSKLVSEKKEQNVNWSDVNLMRSKATGMIVLSTDGDGQVFEGTVIYNTPSSDHHHIGYNSDGWYCDNFERIEGSLTVKFETE